MSTNLVLKSFMSVLARCQVIVGSSVPSANKFKTNGLSEGKKSEMPYPAVLVPVTYFVK